MIVEITKKYVYHRSTMSRIVIDLCSEVLKLYFGDTVSQVGTYLLRNKVCTLPAILRSTDLELKQVKEALCVLIQQNIVRFDQVKNSVIEYEACAEEVLARLRFPLYIHCAKTLYGDAAELLIEELLLQGQATLGSIVEKTTLKLNESIASNASSLPEIPQTVVQDKVSTLVKARLIRRCENVMKDKAGKAVAISECQDPESLFVLPAVKDFDETAEGGKRLAAGDGSVPAKKIKMEDGGSQAVASICEEQVTEEQTGPSVWRVNTFQFHHHFRDQAIVRAVARTIDQKASEVMRAMLRLSETRTDPTAPQSLDLSFTEIYSSIPKDRISRDSVDQYLRCLAENCHDFVTRVGDSGGGMFQINYYKAVRAISMSQIETVVLERFGSKALRIFHVLTLKKNVEQKQVEEQAMLSPKEAKELLYAMFAENFVSITELSKAPDHAPARTFYLFNVNILQLARMLLEKCYQTVLNIKIKRDKVISENKRLLDKQDRVETIIASLDAEGAVDQKEEVEQMVTPAERKQLTKVSNAGKQLDMSEIQLNDTILILETFLAYTLKPPPPKK